MLFIAGREDIESFQGDERARFIPRPMFPCAALTDTLKWCSTETDGMLPDPVWVEAQIAAGALGGLGELAFDYARFCRSIQRSRRTGKWLRGTTSRASSIPGAALRLLRFDRGTIARDCRR
jgi:hypothetical protein